MAKKVFRPAFEFVQHRKAGWKIQQLMLVPNVNIWNHITMDLCFFELLWLCLHGGGEGVGALGTEKEILMPEEFDYKNPCKSNQFPWLRATF